MSAPDPIKVADAVAHAMMANDQASTLAGIVVVEALPGEVTAEMAVTPAHTNGHGVCHGGMLFLLADTAFALACNSPGPQAVAAACDIVFCRPAAVGDVLCARAVERASFGRSGVYDVTITRGDGDIVAEFRGRSRVIAPSQPGSDGIRIAGR